MYTFDIVKEYLVKNGYYGLTHADGCNCPIDDLGRHCRVACNQLSQLDCVAAKPLKTNKNPWIQTWTGRRLDYIDPLPEDICIEDIAHALARLCRFSGHTSSHYSVAQHCVLMSQLESIKPDFRLEALLHDAHEAYIGDIIAPLKKVIGPAWAEIEDIIDRVVRCKFGLPSKISADVKGADARMLMTEAMQLMVWPPPYDWGVDAEPYQMKITPWDVGTSEGLFLERYKQLTQKQ